MYPTLLELLSLAARDRQLATSTLAAYRRTWLKLVAWITDSSFDLGSLPREEARGYYEDSTGNRSASHHLQVKAGIAFLLDKPSPFVHCLAPRFRPEAQEIKFLETADLAKVLLALRELGTDGRCFPPTGWYATEQGSSLPAGFGLVETELFADTYRMCGLPSERYPVLEVTASLRVHRAGNRAAHADDSARSAKAP